MLARPFIFLLEVVGLIRLELTRPKAPDPKSGVSTNSTTSADSGCKGTNKRGEIKRKGGIFSFVCTAEALSVGPEVRISMG